MRKLGTLLYIFFAFKNCCYRCYCLFDKKRKGADFFQVDYVRVFNKQRLKQVKAVARIAEAQIYK